MSRAPLPATILCLSVTGIWVAGIALGQTALSDADRGKLLDSMRRYARVYVSNLPNFLCVQETEQFEGNAAGAHWHRGDTLTSRLIFQDGREERTLELINNKAIKPGRKRWRAPLTTEGEFGILLDRVLGEGSPAEYHWHGWDAVRGRRVAVFDFCIDRDHSTLSLTINEFAHATFGYHGSLYADPETGAIWRITDASDELPRQLQTRSISTAIDYDEIPIGDANYVLPTAAEVLVTTQSTSIRNEIRFKNYRKFEADSTITFGPAPAANTSKSQPQP